MNGKRGARSLRDAGARVSAGLERAREVRGFGLVLDLLDGTVGDFIRHDGHIYAAAVAFYSAVSLFPFLLLLVSIAGYVFGGVGVGGEVEASALFTDLIQYLRTAVPYLGEDLEATLRELFARRARYGLAGAAALLLSASLVFRCLEFALARVFPWQLDETHGSNRPRNLITSKLVFGAFAMSLVTFFLGLRYMIGFVRGLSASFQSPLLSALGDLFMGEGSVARTLGWYAVVVLAFMVVLASFLQRKARPRPLFAFAGGCLFLALWAVAGWGFDLYLGRFASLPATYGPWAALIVIQLWIFYSALAFILACEFVEALQRHLGKERRAA